MRGRGLIKHRYSGKGGIQHSHSPERCRRSYERNMTSIVSQTSDIVIFVNFIFCVRKAAVLDLTLSTAQRTAGLWLSSHRESEPFPTVSRCRHPG